ncbi:MAG: WxcM-like domain-containing protein [Bacteroidota bacterium]|nr:WxcM-like domain-containing protein [Bacteroidota bacterium]
MIIYPKDWHKMYQFSNDAILMILVPTTFDPSDYIYENYE